LKENTHTKEGAYVLVGFLAVYSAAVQMLVWVSVVGQMGGQCRDCVTFVLLEKCNGATSMVSRFSELFEGNSVSECGKRMQVSNCQENPWFVQVMTLSVSLIRANTRRKLTMICVRYTLKK